MGDGRTSVRAGLRADLRRRADGHRSPGTLLDADAGRLPRRVRADAALRARQPAGVTCLDPNNSAAGGDYVCLQPGVPIFGSSPTGAPPFNIFHVPDDFQLGLLPLLPPHVPARGLRNNSVTVSYVGSRGKGLVWRKEINAPPLGSPTSEPGSAAAVPRDSSRNTAASSSSPTTASRGTTACSCRSGRTRGTASTRSTTTRCRSAPTTTRATATRANAQAANPYDPADNKGPCNFDIRHNFNVGGSYDDPGRLDRRRTAADRRRLQRAVRAAVHARAGHDRQVGSGRRT